MFRRVGLGFQSLGDFVGNKNQFTSAVAQMHARAAALKRMKRPGKLI